MGPVASSSSHGEGGPVSVYQGDSALVAIETRVKKGEGGRCGPAAPLFQQVRLLPPSRPGGLGTRDSALVAIETRTKKGRHPEPPLANAGLLEPARPPPTGAAPAPPSVPAQCRLTPRFLGVDADPPRGIFSPPGERISVTPRRNTRSSLSSRTIETDPLRYCATCDRTLPRELFGRDASKPARLKSICLTCDREKARAYYAANRAPRLRRAGAP